MRGVDKVIEQEDLQRRVIGGELDLVDTREARVALALCLLGLLFVGEKETLGYVVKLLCGQQLALVVTLDGHRACCRKAHGAFDAVDGAAKVEGVQVKVRRAGALVGPDKGGAVEQRLGNTGDETVGGAVGQGARLKQGHGLASDKGIVGQALVLGNGIDGGDTDEEGQVIVVGVARWWSPTRGWAMPRG